jgi:hypothetical protein
MEEKKHENPFAECVAPVLDSNSQSREKNSAYLTFDHADDGAALVSTTMSPPASFILPCFL